MVANDMAFRGHALNDLGITLGKRAHNKESSRNVQVPENIQ
jgi:hypothetical protein